METMEDEKTRKAREKQRKKKAKQRASQTLEKQRQLREENTRKRAVARGNLSPEKQTQLREEDTTKRALARDNLSPEKQRQLWEEDIRRKAVIKGNLTSIPRISEFVEVTDSKAKAFQHILKTRIGHNEQLSKEVLDFMENRRKFKDGDSSNLIPLYEQVHQANVCVCCDRFICGTDELCWINKTTLLLRKSRLVLPDLNIQLESCYKVLDPDLHGLLLSPRARFTTML